MGKEDRVKLRVVGITRSQIQDGAYALVLAEEEGERRVPIIVGTAEAQSIAVGLEHIVPPRPLTHDLFITFSRSFGIRLVEVDIYRFEEGVFSAEMVFEDDGRQVSIDARTSDAIAVAIRTRTPIYMARDILERASVLLRTDRSPEPAEEEPLDSLSTERLHRKLDEAVAAERYELAARIHAELKRRDDTGSVRPD